VRVVAGRFGGRRLKAPKGEATRPTADRVKEALFSVLGPLDDLVVADVFAGTGALGIEALSRRAARAVFIEKNPKALEALRDNLAVLGLAEPEATVVTTAAERATKRLAELGPFDLVLLDPPYAQVALAVRFLDDLALAGALATEARAVLEHASTDEPTTERWTLEERRRYGDSSISLFTLPAA
jgi:16S rRNA (guanine966-N2)-methyltransferase